MAAMNKERAGFRNIARRLEWWTNRWSLASWDRMLICTLYPFNPSVCGGKVPSQRAAGWGGRGRIHAYSLTAPSWLVCHKHNERVATAEHRLRPPYCIKHVTSLMLRAFLYSSFYLLFFQVFVYKVHILLWRVVTGHARVFRGRKNTTISSALQNTITANHSNMKVTHGNWWLTRWNFWHECHNRFVLRE